VGCWIALVALQTASGTARSAPEPRKLENVTKQAFDRYVGLTQERTMRSWRTRFASLVGIWITRGRARKRTLR